VYAIVVTSHLEIPSLLSLILEVNTDELLTISKDVDLVQEFIEVLEPTASVLGALQMVLWYNQ
jgi:hypothetical protein